MANKKFNFKTVLLNISGEPMKEQTKDGEKEVMLSTVLANGIMSASINDGDLVMKYFAWGLELNKSGEIALDKVDEAKLRQWILSNPSVTLLGKGRLIEVMDNTK